MLMLERERHYAVADYASITDDTHYAAAAAAAAASLLFFCRCAFTL